MISYSAALSRKWCARNDCCPRLDPSSAVAQHSGMFYRLYIAGLSVIAWATLVFVWMIKPVYALVFGALALLAGTWIWLDDKKFERDYDDET